MNPAGLIGGLINGYGGPVIAVLALAILFRRTGHGWVLILAAVLVPLAFTVVANMGLAAAVSSGWLSADVYFFALKFRGWVVPAFMLFLALKRWPVMQAVQPEKGEIE